MFQTMIVCVSGTPKWKIDEYPNSGAGMETPPRVTSEVEATEMEVGTARAFKRTLSVSDGGIETGPIPALTVTVANSSTASAALQLTLRSLTAMRTKLRLY
jgi:hypothetical protein